MNPEEAAEKEFIEQFKLRRLIKKLELAQGNGTSLITMYIPAGKRATESSQLITEEIGKADNIKDRVNRQSVVGALTSVKEKIKFFLNKNLENGLALFCGNALLPGHKEEKKMMIAIEPYKPINTKLYKCGDKFETDLLKGLLETSERYGFIIVDGNGTLYGVLQGNNRTIVSQFFVDLPKKHNKGGQSSNRFANIRTERRLIYTKKVCEEAVKAFITDNKPNVSGIIIAGYADFKSCVFDCNEFDPRLKSIVLKIVDIAYGSEQGFFQAISLSSECFKNVRLVQEQAVLNKFYEEINFDTGKVCFGAEDTVKNLRDGSIQTLIIYDSLELQIAELKPVNSKDNEIVIRYLAKSELDYQSSWTDKKTNIEYKIMDYDPLLDWFSENYTEFKAEIFFVSDKSPEGNQFVKGFGGVGALLRYKIENEIHYNFVDDNEDDDFI